MRVEVLEDHGARLTGRLDNDPEAPTNRLAADASIEFTRAQVSAMSWRFPMTAHSADHSCELCDAETRRASQDLDQGDVQLLTNVQRFGFHLHRVAAEGNEPGFDFTTGLHHLYDYPELVIFGPYSEGLDNVITELSCRVRGDERFDDDRNHADLFENALPRLRPVAPVESYYREHFGYHSWFYRSWNFPVLQMQWSDREGRFPEEPGFDPRFANWQLRLDRE